MVKESFILRILRNLNYWDQRITTAGEAEYNTLLGELDNLKTAISYGSSLPETITKTAELAARCYPFVELKNLGKEWIPILENLLSKQTGLTNPQQLQLLVQWGFFASQSIQSDNEHFTTQMAQATQIASSTKNLFAQSRIHHNLARYYERLSDWEKANAYFKSASTFVQNNHPVWGAIQNNWGLLLMQQGDLETAEQKLCDAITTWQKLGRQHDLMRTYNNLAQVALKQHDFDLALLRLNQALRLTEKTEDEIERTNVYLNLGALLYDQKRFSEAQQMFTQINTSFLKAMERHDLVALTFHGLGDTAYQLDEIDIAISWLKRAIEAAKITNNVIYHANSLGTMAEAIASKESYSDAVAKIEEALYLLSESPSTQTTKMLKNNFENLPWYQRRRDDKSLRL